MIGEYSLQAIEKLMADYIDLGGIVYEVGDNGVGLGTVILYNNETKYCNYIVKEIYLNEWSSTHTVRRYSKLPKKYMKILKEASIIW